MLTRRWLILKRPWAGAMEKRPYAPSLIRVVKVCVKLVRLRVHESNAAGGICEAMHNHTAPSPRAQHNLLIDRAPHALLTYIASDVTGEHECLPGRRRPNHRGEMDDIASHTLASGPNPTLTGEEAHAAWYAPGEEGHDPNVWDPEYLEQVGGGHRVGKDSQVRRNTTDYMKLIRLTRPTRVHWRSA
jgi:hypothetical protein